MLLRSLIKERIIVIILFIVLVILTASILLLIRENTFTVVKIVMTGTKNTLITLEHISEKLSITPLYANAVKVWPLAETNPVKIGMYANIKSDNSFIAEEAPTRLSDKGIINEIIIIALSANEK